ncbi:MgtC/SapB family protein [Caenimonas sedimenti]|uniref:Protein MgtC n=1 Tax=Caenimonas sedimenti TaxID=2596921 RepID=A0A562ZQC8_9BURK|nr:MgtC/SapB family protein [Caenimonas sedimenti]TWO70495.1 MgtC/SapB family protein [Caenimonas sedimenti]
MAWWDTVVRTVASEFSDLADAEQLTRLVVRLLLAAVLGGLLGLQRERQGKEAGIRTHMLVAAGSALFVLAPMQAGMDAEGLSRVLQGLLAGVGFICAGSILKLENEEQVKGLTTAAGIWMTAAIGMCAGLGRESTAVLSTLLVLGILALEGPLTRWGLRKEGKQD